MSTTAAGTVLVLLLNTTTTSTVVFVVWVVDGCSWKPSRYVDLMFTTNTKQPHLSAIVQSRRLSLFRHIARMPDETDLNSFPRRKLDETTGTSLYYMNENHSAGSEIQRPQYGRCSWPGSEPSTLEIDVYVRRYAFLVVLARNDDDDDDDQHHQYHCYYYS